MRRKSGGWNAGQSYVRDISSAVLGTAVESHRQGRGDAPSGVLGFLSFADPPHVAVFTTSPISPNGRVNFAIGSNTNSSITSARSRVGPVSVCLV